MLIRGREEKSSRGELQSRSRGSIFVLLWRCAWQFGEVLGGIFRLREEESFRTGSDGDTREIFCEKVVAFGNVFLGGATFGQFVQVGGHGQEVRLRIQLMIGRLIIWGHLLAGNPRQVPGRYKGKLLACDLTGAQMSLLEILVPGGFFFNFIRVKWLGKAYD